MEKEQYLKNFLPDMSFNYRLKQFVKKLQENNMEIWRSLTSDTAKSDTDKTIIYDPEVLERLRDLGYLR